MIANNYRKHPAALAVQLPLPFTTALVWHTARPGSRVLRSIRAAVTRTVKLLGHTQPIAKPKTPAWFKAARSRARNLAGQVKDACMVLWAEVRVSIAHELTGYKRFLAGVKAITRLIGFKYEEELASERAADLARQFRPRLKICMNCDKRTRQHVLALGLYRCTECGCKNGALGLDEADQDVDC